MVNGDRDEQRPDSGGGDTRDDRSVFTGISQLCETAVRRSGVDGAAVAMLTKQSRLRELVYATDPIAQRIDEVQFTLGEGPCLDAFEFATPQLVDDVTEAPATSKWPVFTAELVEVGASAVFAFPVSDDGRSLGVLELYRATPGALSTSEYSAAFACAEAAAQTIVNNWADYLQNTEASSPADALAEDLAASDQPGEFSRSRIYMASGMLAVQIGVLPAQALDRMRAYAFQTGRSISRVAEDIIARALTHADFVEQDR